MKRSVAFVVLVFFSYAAVPAYAATASVGYNFDVDNLYRRVSGVFRTVQGEACEPLDFTYTAPKDVELWVIQKESNVDCEVVSQEHGTVNMRCQPSSFLCSTGSQTGLTGDIEFTGYYQGYTGCVTAYNVGGRSYFMMRDNDSMCVNNQVYTCSQRAFEPARNCGDVGAVCVQKESFNRFSDVGCLAAPPPPNINIPDVIRGFIASIRETLCINLGVLCPQ